MDKAATSPELRTAFESQLEETRGQINRLEQVFQLLNQRSKGKHCDGIAGTIEDGSSAMDEDFDEQTMDAVLIASGQPAEHYEMAPYGTLVARAQALGETEAAQLLEQTLNEQKAADKKLTMLAEGGNNQRGRRSGDEEEDEEEAPVKARGRR
jgi:ferritin-like metal-binding protein YciE